MDFLSFLDTQSQVDILGGQSVQSQDELSNDQETEAVDEFVHVATTQSQDDDSSVRSLEDHNVIVGFPPGTLMDLLRSEPQEDAQSSCGGTILSSAPSGVVFDLPPPSQSVYALSPRPHMAVGSALSISTTESMYGEEFGATGDTVVIDDLPSERNLDTNIESTQFLSVPTTLDSSIADDWTMNTSASLPREVGSISSNSNLRSGRHDRSSFVNVGDRLSAVPEGRRCSWYSNYNEQDWERFRQTSDAVLDALEPSQSSKIVLPPEAPPGSMTPGASYKASELLPTALVCPFCNDAIVGATALSCACPSSTVCISCWENHANTTNSERNDSKPTCPSCQCSVVQAVPCHALDVAILAHIQHSDATSCPVKHLQEAYYYRLNRWRNVLEKRRQQLSMEKEARREALLAQYIQREEELLWKKPETKVCLFNVKKWAFLSEIAMLLFAASLGLKFRARS